MNVRRFAATVGAGLIVMLSISTISGNAFGSQGAKSATHSVTARSRSNSSSATLTVAETVPPPTLDPYASSLESTEAELALSYQCLMQTSPSGVLQPALATSYTLSANHRTYTYTLRQHVHFQNGQLLTSTDVVYSYHRLFKSGSPTWTGLYTNFKGNVTAEGPHKVVFKLTAPNAGFPLLLASPVVQSCAILSHTAGAAGGLATKMVGTGPWRQVAYTPDVSLTLKRYADYWGTKTALPNLKLLFIPDSSTQVADFEAGSVDIMMPPESAVSGLKADANAVVKVTPSANTSVLAFNTDAPPFNNVDVRRAVAVALNRTALAQLAYGGVATPTSLIPPEYSWGTPLASLPYSTYNPTEAKQLLADAGYPNGVTATLQYITGYDYGIDALMTAEQSELAAVGINVTLVPETTAAWVANEITSYTGTVPFTMGWNEGPYWADPALYVSVFSFMYGPGKGALPAELTTLTNRALAAPNTKAFESDINALEKYEDNIVYPTMGLFTLNDFVAYQKGITGVSVPISGSTAFLANVKGA